MLIEASCAFPQNVLVCSTDGEIWSLVTRLRAESKGSLVRLSNSKFRECITYNPKGGAEPSDAFERFCGNVLVFYCARVVLDGCGIPTR